MNTNMSVSLSERYLTELGIERGGPLLDQINQMIAAHLRQFTFNNVDILLQPDEILSLETEDLFRKIVIEGRGGYCFEHNKLFYEVLKDMRLDVTAVLARVIYGKPEIDVPRTHRLSILRYEQTEYLIDVGFGPYTPPYAVPFVTSTDWPASGITGKSPDAQKQVEFHVRENPGRLIQLETEKNGEPFTLYTFDRQMYQESDFISANFYTNRHPNSKFVNHLIVSRISDTEIQFLQDLVFSEVRGTQRTDVPIGDALQFTECLWDRFQIRLSSDEYERLYRFCAR